MTPLETIKSKIVEPDRLAGWMAGWRVFGKKIVFTNGCFDIIHPGHIYLLMEAASAGDKLIIGLNSDNSVKKIKGPQRPVTPQASRALVLASINFVDAVVLFDEETPLRLIELLQPDVLVKGGDYKEGEIAGAELIKTRGGEVKIIPLLEGYSTTAMIKKAGENI